MKFINANNFIKWVIVPVIAGIIVFGVTKFAYGDVPNYARQFLVEGDSMLPTLHDKQVISANDMLTPSVGDVVVFTSTRKLCSDNSHDTLVKRVAEIKDGNYWVRGDNPEHSCDSRDFGWVNPKDLTFLGVVDLSSVK